jgi:hypothetical protein
MSSAADPTTATATDQQLQGVHGWPPTACDVEDLWTAWRDACHDLRLAHRAWRDAAETRRREAYFVVVAAADREAVAGETLRRISARP